MIQKIDLWGNSLGLRLPKTIAKQLSLNEGGSVVMTIEKNALVLRPQKKHRSTLKELIGQITKQNMHRSIEWGEPQGKEIW